MAEPVRKIAKIGDRLPERPDCELPDEEPGITLLRWVEAPGGKRKQVEMPLTPELFLNPQVGDQMAQGRRHADTAREITGLLEHFFRSAPDVLVTFDLKHLLGPGLPKPSPDVSVIRGVRNKEADRYSFNIRKEGVRPCLVIEVVSPLSSRIRQVDLVDKVGYYSRAGIAEYLIADSRHRDRRFRLLGYRLDAAGSYRRIEPDDQGRLLSETTGLWFQASPDGGRVLISEHPSGRPLLTRKEEEILLKAAEERARVEAEARKAAEEETARLRAELDRLRSQS
jgi:Uma2 family endonuclease